jgi:hypothetical protein
LYLFINLLDIKRNILQGLASLPAPKAFQPQLPDLGDLDGEMEIESKVQKGTSNLVVDSQDIERANKLNRELEHQHKLSLRSEALKYV